MANPSLFSPTDREALLRRIRGLSPTSPALWGKMGVAQMLAHCRVPLRVATGETKLKRGLVGILFGGLAKRSMLSEKPFSKGLPTDPAFAVRDARDFATERDGLVADVERVARGGEAGLTTDPHPFFGRLTPAQWGTLLGKHLDHHLRQFGA